MKRPRVAVIGLGNMGQHHVRNYSEMPEVDLVAVCDSSRDKVQGYEKKYGLKGFTDIEVMLADMDLDAVSLSTPTWTHFKLGKRLISHGIHLLIEKPIAASLAEADELIALADKKGVTLAVGHIERFNPVVVRLKEMVQSGELGKITSLVGKRVGGFPPQIKGANVVIDLAVHDIDIFSYILNKHPKEVYGHTGQALDAGQDDYAEIFLRYGEQSGFIQVNWITPVRVRQLSVTGTKGYAELDYIQQELSMYKSDYTKELSEDGHPIIKFQKTEKQTIPLSKQEPLRAELSHFIEVIQNKTQSMISGSVGRNSLEIALKALSST